MKNIVIYHKADYDGIFSREIAKIFLDKDTEYIGWDYGDKIPEIPNDVQLYMIDISVEGLMNHPNLIWIDHHKSAIEKFPASIAGYRIDGVAACRLAYQWFMSASRSVLPTKQKYDDRLVNEPFGLTLAGEYDVWVHKGDGDIEFQFGLDSQNPIDWQLIFRKGAEGQSYVAKIIADGKIAYRCYAKREADIMRDRSFMQEWLGFKFLTLNTPRASSTTFESKDVPETGHDALMAFFWNGKEYSFSLYHAKHRKELDLSVIATKFGGGGHKGACGFRVKKLPF